MNGNATTAARPDGDDARWRALAGRDRSAAGAFFYGVRTTGVFCRVGCPARLPRRENVAFFDTAAEALRGGYRPCRRCRPELDAPGEPAAAAVVGACRRMEQAEAPLRLAELAATAGLSRWHFQRVFKRVLGVTPREYQAALRSERFRQGLQQGLSVTEAIHAAGFGASSSAYESADGDLGMQPSAYRNGGAGERVRQAVASCSLGWVGVAASGRGICAIELGDGPDEVRSRLREALPRAELDEDGDALEPTLEAVIACIEAPGRGPELPLDIRGTAFRRQVWRALRAVPAGTTVTYAELAERIGRPQAARAVAGAVAANHLAVAVPCHRVVRSDGGLGGYRWGIERKRRLLDRES